MRAWRNRSAKVATQIQRLITNCSPQSTQKMDCWRRATACLLSVQGSTANRAFTMPPHFGQWPTGAS